MNFYQNITVCITGAGSGMGREIALQLARLETKLIICDYNEVTLRETTSLLDKIGASYFADVIDISDKAVVEKFICSVKEKTDVLDILINNAGIAGKTADLNVLTIEEIEQVMDINLWGSIYCTLGFLPFLKNSKRATIVNISSLAGLSGVLGALPYTISKFALRGFSEALRLELMEDNISVIQVHPGVVKTNIVRNIPGFNPDEAEKSQEVFNLQKGISAEAAADKIIAGIRKNKPRILIGPNVSMLDKIVRLFPGSYSRLIYPQMKKIIDDFK